MSAWMQTSSGRPFDLLAPDEAALDVAADIAAPLAGLARFNAHRTGDRDGGGPIWSVAQHCCVGADAVLAETGDPVAALAFLLHDAHEALIGDITTPAVQAIEEMLGTVLRFAFGLDAEARVRSAIGSAPLAGAIRGLKASLDHRLHRLAGLPCPLPEPMLRIVAEMDLRMLDLERRQILGPVRGAPGETIWPAAVRQSAPVRIHGRLTPWPRRRSTTEWMTRFDAWRIRPAAAA
jgi:hypothetical protein